MTRTPDAPAAVLRAVGMAALRAAVGELRGRPGSITALAAVLIARGILPKAAEPWIDYAGAALLAFLPAVATIHPPAPTDAIRIRRRPQGSPKIPTAKARPAARKTPRRKKAVPPPDAA